jgi:hypothetical protein
MRGGVNKPECFAARVGGGAGCRSTLKNSETGRSASLETAHEATILTWVRHAVSVRREASSGILDPSYGGARAKVLPTAWLCRPKAGQKILPTVLCTPTKAVSQTLALAPPYVMRRLFH